jgi:hypothetical protein
MVGRSAQCGRGVFFIGLFLGLLTFPSLAWGSLRIGNADIQVAYEQQHAFQYDNGEYGMNWVQFRNELNAEFTYNSLIQDGLLFEQVEIPFVYKADFYAKYRGRFDPVYILRNRYRTMFDDETAENFIFPENEFREIFLDLDFGEVGPGELSMRIGRQQVVWGESDLFRSLDIIHPLELDQSSLVGERFDDIRTPLWIWKFLYYLGEVGPLSQVGIEAFYSPNWQPLPSDLIAPLALRTYTNDLPRFRGFGALGQPLFTRPQKPYYDRDRGMHPWAVSRQGFNQSRDAVGPVCLFTYNCVGQGKDEGRQGLGDRISANFNWDYANLNHNPHGWGVEKSMVGVRLLAKTGFGVDFTLNYLFKRTDGVAKADINDVLDRPASLASGTAVPRIGGVYALGLPPPNDLYTGIARCAGSSKPVRNIPGVGGVTDDKGRPLGDQGRQSSALLIGTDLMGYNANGNPNDDIGISLGTLSPFFAGGGISLPPGLLAGGPLVPLTACFKVPIKYPWTHILGVTATYNDFDYTGAVFRLEQGFSSHEGVPRFPPALHRLANLLVPASQAPALGIEGTSPAQLDNLLNDGLDVYSPVWKSMVGFDLIQSWASFPGLGWMKYAPLDIGTQTTFFTGQFLTEYQWSNQANRIAASTGHLCFSLNPRDRCNRWNMAATFVIAGAGYGRGRFEPLAALGYDPATKFPILVYRMSWRGLFGMKNLDFYGGTAVYMGSKSAQSWLALNNYADRDALWLRLIYYLL